MTVLTKLDSAFENSYYLIDYGERIIKAEDSLEGLLNEYFESWREFLEVHAEKKNWFQKIFNRADLEKQLIAKSRKVDLDKGARNVKRFAEETMGSWKTFMQEDLQKLEKDFEGSFISNFEESAQDFIDKVPEITPGPFKLTDRKVLAKITERANILSQNAAGMEWDRITTKCADWFYFKGKHPNELMGFVSKTPGYIRTYKGRSKTIARTEVAWAQNEGTNMQMAKTGVPFKKFITEPRGEWPCDLCVDNENQGTIGRTEDFTHGEVPVHPRCFIDSQTPIYTSKGWKPIGKIKINDLVLTHKKRFRKVIQLHKTPKQKVYVVNIATGNRPEDRVTMTANHPILVDGEWKEANDIDKGMKITYLSNQCEVCGKLIPYYNRYCSLTCSSKASAEKQWDSEEHRKNISEKNRKSMLLQYATGKRDRYKITRKANEITRKLARECNHIFQQEEIIKKMRAATNLPHHREQSSKRMKENNPSCNPEVRKRITESLKNFYLKHPEKHPNRIMAKKGFVSNLEQSMMKLLDALKIDYIHQFPIKRYFADFFLPEYEIVIEVDGGYWHQDKKSDLMRQRDIESYGYMVIRFSDDELEDQKTVTNELLRACMNHDGEFNLIEREVKEIKKWELRKRRTLYNFSVEEDESYIAKGFVVHNCRCAIIPVVPDDWDPIEEWYGESTVEAKHIDLNDAKLEG